MHRIPILLALLGMTSALTGAEQPAELSTSSASAILPSSPSGEPLLPGDLLHVEVYENPDLTTVLRVPGEGTVRFPLLGEITIPAGSSCDAFARQLQDQLEARFLNRALVTVTVKEYAARRVYLMGGVARPGALRLDPATPASAIRVISEAGGLADDADLRRILVMRDDGRGGSTILPVQIDGATPTDVALLPNDLILVARLGRIFITGQVKQPGSVPSGPANLTVTRALSLVGGFDKYARMSHVQILRAGEPVRVVDVAAILAGDGEDPVLAPGDMINVPERRF